MASDINNSSSPHIQQGVLVPLDGSKLSERALRYAELLPTRQLRLVVVEPIVLSAARERWARDEPTRWGTWPIHSARSYLDFLAVPFREQGWDVEIVVLSGEPGPSIVEAAMDSEMIVMSTRGHGLTRRLLGTTADYVAGHSGIPTLLIRDEHPPAYSIFRIVVPLDGSVESEEALPLSVMLQKRLGVDLHLIRVIDPSTSLLTAEELRNEVASYLEMMAHRLGDVPGTVATEVPVGHPEERLLEALQLGDLVVMATKGKSPLRRFVIGGVSTAVIDRAPVPVALIHAAPGEMAGTFERVKARVSARGTK